jgi:sphingolipid delta-4 desaturase
MYVGSAYCYGGVGAVIYMFSALFFGSGLHVSAIHFVAEHYMLTPETSYMNNSDLVEYTFSYYGPINKVLYNGGYHVEHHDFPRVSWKLLPRL